MEFVIPEKTSRCKLSPIREVIAKGANIPDFISLAIGNPAAEAIPVEDIQRAAKKVIDEMPLDVMQYGPAIGDPEFMEITEQRLVEKKGINPKNQIMSVMSGSGQGLGLVARAFTTPGDEVYAEAFSYPSAINSVRCVDARVVGILTDEKGMLPEELEKAAKSGKGRYIYLNPTFSNPTGRTMPLERRKEIYEVARKYGLLIYEDDPYGDIRFKGEPVPAFKSFDEDGRVLYAGSYSKTLSAGLRLGYLYGEEKYITPIRNVKNVMDGECPLYNQRIIVETLKGMDYEEHLVRLREIYSKKCEGMLNVLKEESSSKVQFSEPEGGMFVWATLPEDVDINKFYEALFANAVGAVKSEAFASELSNPGHSFRLNYTYLPLERVQEGARRFGQVTKKMCGE